MLVIGNGESRKNINIEHLDIPKIGCNAIYRDYLVDHLVCVDRRMVNEVIDAGANNDSFVYTRSDWYPHYSKYKKVRTVPDLPYVGMDRPDRPFQWGSGPYAVLLGANLSKLKKVKLIGFDLYSDTKFVNNVYKGTSNYDAAEKRAIDPRYWIYQIGKVFECYPEVEFTIYQKEGWQSPNAWIRSNVKVDKISNLL